MKIGKNNKMAKLIINSDLDSIYVVGSFCNWDLDKAKKINRNKSGNLCFNKMPKCEYKVLASRDWKDEEKPIKFNRIFSATKDEAIDVLPCRYTYKATNEEIQIEQE